MQFVKSPHKSIFQQGLVDLTTPPQRLLPLNWVFHSTHSVTLEVTVIALQLLHSSLISQGHWASLLEPGGHQLSHT